MIETLGKSKMSSRPRFAIVTPSYNQAAYLEQTILSVLNQSGRGTVFDLQYAVIDGGSRDDSAAIIRKYEGELTYWCSERDRGQTHAINKGFTQVHGEIHAYLNSDDFYREGALEKVAQAFASNDKLDFVHGICDKVDADGNLVIQQLAEINSLAEIVDLWSFWLRPKRNLNFIQPEVFWSSRLAETLGPFDESLHYTMDFDYWLRGFDLGMQVLAIDTPLAAFRMHEQQKTAARGASILELLDRVEPYLRGEDSRINPENRQRMLALLRFTHKMIAEEDSKPSRQVLSLLSLIKDEPKLLTTNQFWRQFTRSSRRAIWDRRSAA